jgi:hypothetical protein
MSFHWHRRGTLWPGARRPDPFPPTPLMAWVVHARSGEVVATPTVDADVTNGLLSFFTCADSFVTILMLVDTFLAALRRSAAAAPPPPSVQLRPPAAAAEAASWGPSWSAGCATPCRSSTQLLSSRQGQRARALRPRPPPHLRGACACPSSTSTRRGAVLPSRACNSRGRCRGCRASRQPTRAISSRHAGSTTPRCHRALLTITFRCQKRYCAFGWWQRLCGGGYANRAVCRRTPRPE